jgi:hypothetical protein
MSDMLVVGGYQAAGYNTIIVDDCWLDMARDKVHCQHFHQISCNHRTQSL